MKKISVLIAEDNRDTRHIMVKKIKDYGYDVVEAPDGREAVEQIQKNEFDVIILDLNMPRLDGHGVMRYLREHKPKDQWQPVVVISAYGQTEEYDEAFFAESDLFLQKPCRMRDILNAVALMLNLKQQECSVV